MTTMPIIEESVRASDTSWQTKSLYTGVVNPNIELSPEQEAALEEIYRIMSLRFESGFTDTAERHNEHQP